MERQYEVQVRLEDAGKRQADGNATIEVMQCDLIQSEFSKRVKAHMDSVEKHSNCIECGRVMR